MASLLEVLKGDESIRCQNQELIPTANRYVTLGLCCIISDFSRCLRSASRTQKHSVARAEGREHHGPFLLSQPTNPNLAKNAPILKWRSLQRRSPPHYTARADNAAEQRCIANQAKHRGWALTDSAPSPRHAHPRGHSESFLRRKRLPLPPPPSTHHQHTSGGSSCGIWVPSKREGTYSKAFQTKTHQGRQEPFCKSNQQHYPGLSTAHPARWGRDSSSCSPLLHCHLPSSQACI